MWTNFQTVLKPKKYLYFRNHDLLDMETEQEEGEREISTIRAFFCLTTLLDNKLGSLYYLSQNNKNIPYRKREEFVL